MSHIAAVLKPRSVSIATDFSAESEKGALPFPGIGSIYGSRLLTNCEPTLLLLWGCIIIIMGLHHSAYVGVISHLDPATTYEVVCGANSPVLTVRCSSEHDLRPRATVVTASLWCEADAIRIHGFGAKW